MTRQAGCLLCKKTLKNDHGLAIHVAVVHNRRRDTFAYYTSDDGGFIARDRDDKKICQFMDIKTGDRYGENMAECLNKD